LCALALMGITPGITAQEIGSPDNTSPSDAMDEVVVTAQKRTERLQDVPLSITELSAAELTRQGVQTTSDMPSVVSGLVWSQQGAWTEPNLRGIYTNVAAVGSPSPIAIYLDGVYQPMQAGTISDLADVSRIEVLKGPQGTLFGRNATGGAISIYTLDPAFTTTGKLDVTGAAMGGGPSDTTAHYNLNGFLSGPFIGHALAGSISAYHDQTNGYLVNDLNGQQTGRITADLVRGKLLWELSEHTRFVGSAYYSYRNDGTTYDGFPQNGVTAAAFYADAVIPTQPWHYAYDGAAPFAETRAKGASLKGTSEFGLGTLTSITGYSNYRVSVLADAHSAYSPSCVAAFACVVGAVKTPNQAWSQEFDFASRQMGRFRFVAGLFGFHNRVKEHDDYNGGGFVDDTTITNTSFAVFAEGTVDITQKLSTIAGVRVSRDLLKAEGSLYSAPLEPYADKGWTSTTPRVSLLYKITPAVNTYFTYSEGFKAGVVSGQINSAPPANPEKISSYELGVKAAKENYSANVALFDYDYRDLQVEVFNNLVTTPENAAKAQIYGVDFEGAAKLNEALRLRLVTTFLPKAEYSSFPNAIAFVPPLGPYGLTTDNDYDATGSRMLVTPRWTGTLSATYTKHIDAGTVDATTSVYYSTRYRWEYTGAVTTGAYALLNAKLGFMPKGSDFKFTVFGKNLTNKAYMQGTEPTSISHQVFWSQPREVGVTAEYSF